MTLYDDAQLNSDNPLILRSPTNGAPFGPKNDPKRPKFWQHPDQNMMNLVRDAGEWTDRNYVKNETIWADGIDYRAKVNITAPGPHPWEDDGSNWELTNPSHGYGEMSNDDVTAGSDLGSAFQPVSGFDTIPYTPYGVTFDLVGSTYTLAWRGLWEIQLVAFITFNDSNQGRLLDLRGWNVTDGVILGAPITVSVPRNAGGVNLVVPYRQPITAGQIGDAIRVEVGNARQTNGSSTTITGVEYSYLSLLVSQVAANRPNTPANVF